MKTTIKMAIIAAVMLSGCASLQARRDNGHSYTCVPTDAQDRSAFAPKVPAGSELVSTGELALIGQSARLGSKGYSCIANDARDRGLVPTIPAGEKLTVK